MTSHAKTRSGRVKKMYQQKYSKVPSFTVRAFENLKKFGQKKNPQSLSVDLKCVEPYWPFCSTPAVSIKLWWCPTKSWKPIVNQTSQTKMVSKDFKSSVTPPRHPLMIHPSSTSLLSISSVCISSAHKDPNTQKVDASQQYYLQIFRHSKA